MDHLEEVHAAKDMEIQMDESTTRLPFEPVTLPKSYYPTTYPTLPYSYSILTHNLSYHHPKLFLPLIDKPSVSLILTLMPFLLRLPLCHSLLNNIRYETVGPVTRTLHSTVGARRRRPYLHHPHIIIISQS